MGAPPQPWDAALVQDRLRLLFRRLPYVALHNVRGHSLGLTAFEASDLFAEPIDAQLTILWMLAKVDRHLGRGSSDAARLLAWAGRCDKREVSELCREMRPRRGWSRRAFDRAVDRASKRLAHGINMDFIGGD